MYTADNIWKMIEILIDNIFVLFERWLFRQVIEMRANCAPLLAYLFLYSYDNEIIDNMIIRGHRRPSRSFNLFYRYTDDLTIFGLCQ